MQPNPFLTVLKIAAFAILAFLVWVTFWQRGHLQEQVARLSADTSALTDKVGELGRKVDDLKSKADRVEGAADAMAKMMSGVRVVSNGGGESTRPETGPRAPATGEWGWTVNARLDASADASKSVGTPGRFKNYLELDPDPIVPPEAAKYDQSDVGMVFGPQEKTFNPLTSTSASVQESLDLNCLDTPASEHWKDPYKYGPGVCWRIEIDPEFREYTLFFRRDVVWQTPGLDLTKYRHLAGTHRLTAHDFKFTIDTLLNPQVECAPLRAYFSDCEGVTVIDDFTAVVRWKKTVYHSIGFTLGRYVMPEFFYAFDDQGTRFPAETFGQQFNEHYYNRVGTVGCGPYRMLPYDGGEWITLERFEDWYGIHDGVKLPVRTVRLLVYNDPETPFLKLKAGELSIQGLTASQWKKHVRDETNPKSPFKDGTFVNYEGLRPQYYFVGWKNRHPLFRDAQVRRALALACNREAIAEKIFLGRLVPMGGPIYPGSPSADPDLKPLPYDPKEAVRLLEEAGWKMNSETGIREKEIDGKTKSFEFKLIWRSPSPEIEALINQYRNDLRALGIVMEPEPMEWSLYLEKLHDRTYEAAVAGWGTNAWDQDFEQVWHSKQIQEAKSSNSIEYSNPELDRLSDSLRAEMDVEKRKEKARAVGRILYQDQPVCFLGWINVKGAHWNWLHGALEHQYKTRPFIRNQSMWTTR